MAIGLIYHCIIQLYVEPFTDFTPFGVVAVVIGIFCTIIERTTQTVTQVCAIVVKVLPAAGIYAHGMESPTLLICNDLFAQSDVLTTSVCGRPSQYHR
jgi:hypothetical protein